MSERTVTVRLRALIGDYQKAMQTAAGDTKTFASTVKGNFTQLNQDVGKLGETMTRRVTLPLVGVGVGAVKLASDFETAFGQMVGLAGVAADEIDGLREAVLKLSHDTARGPTELAQALYFIRSSGIDAAHAMGVLEVAAKASAAGLGSTVTVADAVTSAMNAYGAANLSAQQATDILVAAVREGKTEAAALAPQLGILIPTAAAMGISFAQVAGVMAVMSRTGLDAAEASTSLNAIFSTLLGTSKEGVAALEEHRLSLKSLRDTAAGPGGLVAVMRILDSTFADNDEALSQVIPNVRAFRGVMNVLAQDAGSVDTVMQNVANSTGATNDALAAMKATEAFKIKQAFADLQVTLVNLGAVLAPIVAQFATGLAAVVSGFDALPGPIKEVVVWLGLIAVTAGPALKAISVIGQIGGPAIKLLGMAFKAMRAEIIAAQIAGESFGVAMATEIAAVSVAVLGVVGLLVGFADVMAENAANAAVAAANIDGFKTAIEETGNVTEGAKKHLLDMLGAGKEFAAAFSASGISIDDAAKALAAGGAEWENVVDRIIAAGTAVGGEGAKLVLFRNALLDLSDELTTGAQHANNYAMASETSSRFLGMLGITAGTVAIQLAGAGGAAANAAQDMTALSAGVDGAAASATVASNSVARLIGWLNALSSGTFGVVDAQQGFSDALADVDDAAKATGGGGVRDLTGEQRRLEKATKDVTKAQEELADAEKALADARKGPSTRDKSDAALDVREATLAVKEATKAQADARKKLLDESKKGKDGDVAGARLDLESASIRLKRAQDRLTDSQAAQNKVMHSGEETSDNVKDALDNLKDAQERVTDATQAQTDAEAQLRGESGGGPVADRSRNIARSYDQVVSSAKNVIQSMIDMKKPADEIVTELDKQTVSAQKLIAAYGDPDGKLAKFIELNERLRLIFTDDKFITNFTQVAGAIGGAFGEPIPNIFGSDSTGSPGRAHGGPVGAGATVRVTEQGDEYLTMGNKPGYVSTAAQMASLYSSPMMSAASSGVAVRGGDSNVIVYGSVYGTELDNVVFKALQSWVRHNGALPLPTKSPN